MDHVALIENVEKVVCVRVGVFILPCEGTDDRRGSTKEKN